MDGATLLQVLTYDTSKCDLDHVSILTCYQEFDIYAQSYTGIIAKVATLKITIRKECFGVATLYSAMSSAEKAAWWSWDTELKDQFSTGYRVRNPQATFSFPTFDPKLPSGKDSYSICG